MQHEQMLAWLDEASSFYVRDAADRLEQAAQKMRVIAQQLRDRTGRVDWKGEAEKAFTDWAESVASSTHKLADYSTHASKWMGDASDAIATAQSAIPRYTSHAQAKDNLDAALKYRNDPDAQSVARNARGSMAGSDDAAAIKAKEEANRQAAAAEMEKLSSAYQWSSHQMSSFDPPTFPPPPGAFVPDYDGSRGTTQQAGSTQQSDSRSVGTDTGTTQPSRTRHDVPAATPDHYVPPAGDKDGPTYTVRPEVRPDVLPEVRPDEPVDLGIDSVNTLPPPTTTGPGPSPVPSPQPPLTKPDGFTPPFVTTGVPPFTGKGGTTPLPPTAPTNGGGRGPLTNGGLRGLAPGHGPLGGGPREGISGGRAVPSTQAGRPATGIPRSTVIGTEQGGRGAGVGRAPMAGGMGAPMGGAMGAGQSGVTGGRRLAGEVGGVVGGRPQATGAAAGRPFTPGGSGLVRGGNTPAGEEREEQKGERPDYLVEDEETWQRNRRVAPPVID
ncbi:WXG100 family type VII secretion target [Streptomyces sp. NPDC058855]|uniref:WXG100 family type VII secretion target n=1 Tax=Streptomyces sp. NPDC058855 TaxID=3346651 RepID=UPI00368D389D